MPEPTDKAPRHSDDAGSPLDKNKERGEGLTSKGLSRLKSDLLVTCWVLLIVLLGGLVVACIGFWGHATAALLWISACLVIGGITGFLFAIPRVTRVPAKNSVHAGAGAGRDASTAAMPTPHGTERGLGLGINTNLEEISDWLTKILVGLGLVELGKVPDYLQRAGYYVGQSLGENRQAAASGLIVFFLGFGFLCGYLLTRMFVGPAFRLADQATALGVAEDVATALDLAEAAKREGVITRQLYDVLDAAFTEVISANIRHTPIPRTMAMGYIEVLRTFLNKLKGDPQWSLHRRANLLLAALYKRTGDLDSAIAVLSAFINCKRAYNEIDMHLADALYNRACYHALKFQNSTGEKAAEYSREALGDLRDSILISPGNAESAAMDDDFQALWDDPIFKSLVHLT